MKRFDVMDRNNVRTSVLQVDQWEPTGDPAKILVNKGYLSDNSEKLLIGNLVAASNKIYEVTTYDDLSYTCFYRGEIGRKDPVGIIGASIQEEAWNNMKKNAIPLHPIKKIRCPNCKYPHIPSEIKVNKDLDGVKEYECIKCNHVFWSYEAEYILQDGTEMF
jgi:DNA-directed RNA polymerase subunit RPC12/RpoP